MKAKLRLLCGTMVLMLVAVVAYSAYVTNDVKGVYHYISDDIAPEQAALNKLNFDLAMFRATEAAFILSSDPTYKAEREQEMEVLVAGLDKSIEEFLALPISAEEKKAIEAFNDRWFRLKELNKRVIPIAREYNATEKTAFLTQAARVFTVDTRTPFLAATELAGGLLTEKKSEVVQLFAEEQGELDVSAYTNFAVAAVAVLLAIIGVLFFERTSLRLLLRKIDQLRQLTAGDASVEVDGLDRRDEVGDMAKALNDFKAKVVQNNDFAGQISAISKAQAVIEFALDGKVVNANENFLAALGYSIDEIRGQHHSMFIEQATRLSPEYQMFWEKLGRGEYDAGQYKRIGKGGKEVWIQASYNPILDLSGKPFKVVKYATDITEQVNATRALELAVEETQGVVQAAENNDLTQRVPLEGKTGAIASLCAGVNGLLETMGSIIGNIVEASSTLTTASREIAMGNTDLSQRTEEQASSLEETAASLEELTSTVKQNAENAQQANALAADASEMAIKGGAVVAEVVHTMDGITEASRKIADIISVIDEIAFQTNILALNAAVEAARAGEQGRGFAVVAAEVRNLAQRSANAAKEIKSLISDSAAKVEVGSKLVESAGKSTEEIVAAVRRVTDIMAQISAASQEQSTGIEQVNTAVTQMDQITQQNAALVEEAAAAAKSMEDQTTQMAQMVAVFKLSSSEGNAVSHAPAAALPATGNPVVDNAVRRGTSNGNAPAKAAKAKTKAEPPRAPEKRRAVAGGNGTGDWKEF
jgi:methyl-accepting chemotaxis protein